VEHRSNSYFDLTINIYQFLLQIFPGKDEASRYGFINFRDEQSALIAMHKLNGKNIPETKPVNFCLIKLHSIFFYNKFNFY